MIMNWPADYLKFMIFFFDLQPLECRCTVISGSRVLSRLWWLMVSKFPETDLSVLKVFAYGTHNSTILNTHLFWNSWMCRLAKRQVRVPSNPSRILHRNWEPRPGVAKLETIGFEGFIEELDFRTFLSLHVSVPSIPPRDSSFEIEAEMPMRATTTRWSTNSATRWTFWNRWKWKDRIPIGALISANEKEKGSELVRWRDTLPSR